MKTNDRIESDVITIRQLSIGIIILGNIRVPLRVTRIDRFIEGRRGVVRLFVTNRRLSRQSWRLLLFFVGEIVALVVIVIVRDDIGVHSSGDKEMRTSLSCSCLRLQRRIVDETRLLSGGEAVLVEFVEIHGGDLSMIAVQVGARQHRPEEVLQAGEDLCRANERSKVEVCPRRSYR